jgi:hypothetical protein
MTSLPNARLGQFEEHYHRQVASLSTGYFVQVVHAISDIV